MSNTLPTPASLQPPTPPINALDTTPGANPNVAPTHIQFDSPATPVAPTHIQFDSPAVPVSTTQQPGLLSRIGQGVEQSLENNLVKPVQAAMRPPQDSKETTVYSVGGLPALDAYRAGKSVVDSTENLIKAPKENFEQAKTDFQRATQEFHNRDYRNALSSVGSTAADITGAVPGAQNALIASRERELTEGARPGGNLATPLAKDVTDLATVAAGEYGPRLAKKLALKSQDLALGRFNPEEAAAKPVSGKFQPAANLSPEEVLKHAGQEGVDLTAGQALKTKPRQAMQGLGERAFIGGRTLEDQIGANREILGKSILNFANDLDPKNLGASEESAGTALQESAQRAKDVLHAKAQAGYRALPDELQDAPVDVSNIRAKWQNIANAEEIALDNLPAETANKLRNVINLGANLGTRTEAGEIVPKITFADAQKLRSAFREMGETTGADLPARYQGMFRTLTSDLDGAMEKTATNSGFADDWRAANENWKNYVTKTGDRQAPIYRILNQTDPARVTRDITARKSAADIDTLKEVGVDLSPVQRQVVADIANRNFRINPDGLGGYSDSFLESLFGPVAKHELYLKAELARRLGFEVNPSGTSNVLAAEMQIPMNKEGFIRGVGGSFGFAKLSAPRAAGEFLPRGPIEAPTMAPALAAIVAENARQNRVVFRASDNSIHSVPQDQIGEAEKIDPNLTVIEPQK